MIETGLKKRLLFIFSENDPDMLFLKESFAREGYDVFVSPYGDMLSSVSRLQPFDAILVDVRPDEPGLIEKCKQVRLQKKFDDTVLIFLSAKISDEMLVKSFDAGVDYFTNKPVGHNVLISKINSAARRLKFTGKATVEETIMVDRERYVVICKGNNVHFPKKEFELLSLLISKSGKVFLRQEILHHVWNLDPNADARTVDVHIHRIRQKLGGDFIKTVKGIGYKISG